jgi:hypothetical protein
VSSGCRNREHGITQSRQFAKHLEFRFNVGDTVGLVRKDQRRKPYCKRILVALIRGAG